MWRKFENQKAFNLPPLILKWLILLQFSACVFKILPRSLLFSLPGKYIFINLGLDSWSPPKIRWDCPMYCWETKPIVEKQYLRFIFGLGQLCESCPWFPRVNVNLAEECLLWYCKGYDFKFHSNQKFFCDWFSDLPSLVMILKIPLIQSHLYFVKISLTSMPNVMKVDCVWTTFVETPHPSLQTKTQFMVKLFTLKYISA